jgi:hypothetical protein
MVGLNVALTAINGYYIVRLLRGRHDPRTYEVAEVQPTEGYLRHLLHSFETDSPGPRQSALCSPGTLAMDPRRWTSTTSYRNIGTSARGSSSTVGVVCSPREGSAGDGAAENAGRRGLPD